jgi:hypothetical protein
VRRFNVVRSCVFSVVLAATAVAGCAAASHEGITADHVGGMTDCTVGGTAANWKRILGTTIEDGMGFYRLRNRQTKVIVVSASLLEPTGGIRLSKVAFQAFDGAGSGVDWDSKVQAIDGDGHPVPFTRRTLPAELTYTSPTGANTGKDGRAWQLTIGLQVTGQGGMVQGVKFTYIYQGQPHTLIDRHPVGIYRTSAECDKNVVLPRN